MLARAPCTPMRGQLTLVVDDCHGEQCQAHAQQRDTLEHVADQARLYVGNRGLNGTRLVHGRDVEAFHHRGRHVVYHGSWREGDEVVLVLESRCRQIVSKTATRLPVSLDPTTSGLQKDGEKTESLP